MNKPYKLRLCVFFHSLLNQIQTNAGNVTKHGKQSKLVEKNFNQQ